MTNLWRGGPARAIRGLANTLGLGLLCALAACGGVAAHEGVGPTSDVDAGGAPSLEGASGASGTDSKPTYWDDTFPWFDRAGVGDFPSGEEDRILHLTAEGTPARAVLSTHLPLTSVAWAQVLEFSARGSAASRLLVSVGQEQGTYDYFARAPDDTWPLTGVDVTTELRTYTVDLAELTPPEDPPGDGPFSMYIAFILDQPEPTEVWIDRVLFKAR